MSGGNPGSQKLANSLTVVKLPTAGAGLQPGPLIPQQEMGWDPQMEPSSLLLRGPWSRTSNSAGFSLITDLKGHAGYSAMKICSGPQPRSKAQT